MSKWAVLVGVSVLGTLVNPVASSAASKPRQDSVNGTGTADFFGQFEIHAQSGPTGESPSGQVTVRGAVFFTGPVTCLRARGNVATMNIQTPQFGLVTMEATDNAGSGTADVINAIPSGRLPSDCSPFGTGVKGDVRAGDIVVVDAPPPSGITTVTTSLSGFNELPALGDPNGVGFAVVTLEPRSGRVCFTVLEARIGRAIASHIHQGAAGVAGPIVVPFAAPDATGLARGCTSADKTLVKSIVRNPTGFYVNVHSVHFPAGAIRGQLTD